MKTVFIYLLISFINFSSLENLILSLEIRSVKDISNYFNSKTEIIINDKAYKGNKFQLSTTLDNFYYENEIFMVSIAFYSKLSLNTSPNGLYFCL